MNILFITTVVPDKPKTGGEIASSHIIKALIGIGHTVKVFGFGRTNKKTTIPNIISVETRYIESSINKLQAFLFLCKSFLLRKPYSCTKYFSKNYVDMVNAELKIHNYDIVIVDHTQMTWIMEKISKLPTIIITHNCEYDLYHKLYNETSSYKFILKTLYYREAKLMYNAEKEAYNKATQVWTMNDTDLAKIKNEFDVKNIHALHIPGGFDQLIEYKKKEYSVAILGTWTWSANLQGLEWFLKNVLPLLNKTIDIHIAGTGADWVRNKYSNVFYHGFVDSAQVFLSKSKCIVIPSTSGSGIQIKTLDAISTDIPIVATPIGVRGINNLPDSVIVESQPKDFAKAIEEVVGGKIIANTSGYLWSQNRKSEFEKQVMYLTENINA